MLARTDLTPSEKGYENSELKKTGEIKDLVWSGCEASFSDAGFAQGDKGKLLINMSFYAKSSGPTYSQSAEGEIIATVQ